MPRRQSTHFFNTLLILLACGLVTGCQSGTSTSTDVRIATFNTALSRDTEGALHAAFAAGDDAKAKLVAEVLQRVRPDIVLLQEIDYDPSGKAYADFQRNYLSVSQNGAKPIQYDYVYAPPVNTGVLAEVDLDGDGRITRPNDCYGYGLFDGQYGMVVLSRLPLTKRRYVAFQEKLWSELPGSLFPQDYYTAAAKDHLRLSSKTHVVVPIDLNGKPIKLWISHPTPPVFDGPEDRNGKRNHDEIRLWREYLEPAFNGDRHLTMAAELDFYQIIEVFPGELLPHAKRFVILGDLNADPNDGASRPGAANQLLGHDRINATFAPTSEGAREAARLQAGANLNHKTDPATDTADWNDTPGRGSGNLRVDYVLPSVDLNVVGSGVYWPIRDDAHAYLNQASDHHMVWIDIALE